MRKEQRILKTNVVQQRLKVAKGSNRKQKVIVQVGNGNGSETATKLEGPMAEFMKFARGIEKNDIDEFIDKQTGKVVDLEYEINLTQQRIQKKLQD